MLASLSCKTQNLVQTPLFKPSHAHLDVKGRTKLVYERARAIARVYGTKAAFSLCPISCDVSFL